MKQLIKLAITAIATITICSAFTFSQGGPTARCYDGTYSYSQHHQGTCSHHAGVAMWYK